MFAFVVMKNDYPFSVLEVIHVHVIGQNQLDNNINAV